MIFFTDECVPTKAARMLSYFEQEHEVRAHEEHFDKGTPDTVWMQVLATWNETTIVISGDGRILKNKAEKRVLKECGLMFVCLAPGWTHTVWRDYGWKIIKVWPDIVRNIVDARYPMVFEVMVGSLKVRPIGRISDL